MNVCSVAVIDSGIDINNYYLKESIIGGINFSCIDNNVISSTNIRDENGHGTACCSIIKNINHESKIYVVKILNKDAKGNSRCLLEALKHLLEIDVSLINLSLSVNNLECLSELKDICDLLSKQGKIIVASLDNRKDNSYPACFNNVFGVRGYGFEKRDIYWYNDKANIQCISDNTPVLIAGKEDKFTILGGNSKASACFSGILLLTLKDLQSCSFKDINKKLLSGAICTSWEDSDIQFTRIVHKYIVDKRDNYNKNDIDQVIYNLGLSEENKKLVYTTSLFAPTFRLGQERCKKVFNNILSDYNINLPKSVNVPVSIFESIYTLMDFIMKYRYV